MHIASFRKSLQQFFVARKSRRDAKLYLRIIQCDEHIAGGCAKCATDATAIIAVDGNDLKIRFLTGTAPRSGSRLQKFSVQAAISRDHARHFFYVCGEKLGEFAIRQNIRYYRMKFRHFFQLVLARRTRSARSFLLFLRRDFQLVKQNIRELFRRAYIELVPRGSEYAGLNFPKFRSIFRFKSFQIRNVQKNPVFIHPPYYWNKWVLYAVVNLLQPSGLF